jgi:hypothetical protein
MWKGQRRTSRFEKVADSTLRLDRRFKSRPYARAGLRENWIVNLVDGVLEVYREPQQLANETDEWVYRSVSVLRSRDTTLPKEDRRTRP